MCSGLATLTRCSRRPTTTPTMPPERSLETVRHSDRYWGTETEYAVAESAVRTTYQSLCASLKAEGGPILVAIQATRRAISAQIEDLRHSLVGLADRTELLEYLERGITRWDFSPWTQGKTPSELERTLQLETIGPSSERSTVGEALEGTWLLTVLGGPGSGKTWLAQRCAREAANAAITQLQDPFIDPQSVEIPILTTWSDWARQSGDGVDALVAAALPSSTDERLRRSILSRGARVFAVIDSLDEVGIGGHRASSLLHSLTTPAGWKVLVTSRPEAWHTVKSALPKIEGTKVGTLVDLTYPDDVQGFIKKWFCTAPEVAKHLSDQITNRPELRPTAMIPLLLTFYCMLTERSPEKPLPLKRRELYQEIIDRLLRGKWSTHDEPEPDLEACRKILQQWAWDAIREANDVAGVGAWPKTITTGLAPASLERALDNVAPKQEVPEESKYDRDRVERLFLHRTLLEHCIAEQIATFDVGTAIAALLPHIWFDPDWEVAAPMALAAHPHRDDLLDELLKSRDTVSTDKMQEFDRFLLRTAAMTEPSDWSSAHQDTIDWLRVDRVVTEPELVVASSSWVHSNPKATEAILTTLATSEHFEVKLLVKTLLSLTPTSRDLERARGIIVSAFREATPEDVGNLVISFVDLRLALDSTDEELKEARGIIIEALPYAATVGIGIRDVTAALHSLHPTEVDLREAREKIIEALPDADGLSMALWVRDLADSLLTLQPSDEDLRKAQKVILSTVIIDEQVWELTQNLVNALRVLGLTEDAPSIQNLLSSARNVL